MDGRRYLIRVRPPFGARFLVDSYVAAFARLDQRFGCRHNVLVREDGGIYTPSGGKTGLGAALRAMSLAETEQLLEERQQARDRFLDLSARAAAQFDAKAWSGAHVALVVFQHLSFPWARELDKRFERATARLDPAARALLLTAETCPDPTESMLAQEAFDALCSGARCLPAPGSGARTGLGVDPGKCPGAGSRNPPPRNRVPPRLGGSVAAASGLAGCDEARERGSPTGTQIPTLTYVSPTADGLGDAG